MSATTAKKFYYFHCKSCNIPYKRALDEVLFEKNTPIFQCPQCGHLTFQVSQQKYASLLSIGRSTGPKTPEGKRRAALNGRNPQRNVSPESRERRAANAWKHGRYAKKLRPFAPAKYDRYPQCANCEDHYREACQKKTIKWCPMVQEPLAQFLQAYKEGKPELLKNLAGYTQAQIYQAVQIGLKDIFDQGVTVIEKRQIGKAIQEIMRAHPVLEKLPELIKLIGFSADQQMLTPAQQETKDTFRGFLDDQEENAQKIEEYKNQINEKIDNLRKEFAEKSAALRENDEALKQFEAEKALEVVERGGNAGVAED